MIEYNGGINMHAVNTPPRHVESPPRIAPGVHVSANGDPPAIRDTTYTEPETNTGPLRSDGGDTTEGTFEQGHRDRLNERPTE